MNSAGTILTSSKSPVCPRCRGNGVVDGEPIRLMNQMTFSSVGTSIGSYEIPTLKVCPDCQGRGRMY